MAKMLSGCLPAWDDRLQEVVVVFFNKRNQVDVPVTSNDEHLLPRVLLQVAVYDDIKEAARFDLDNDLLKGEPPSYLELFVLVGWPTEWLHVEILAHCVPVVIARLRRARLMTPNV